MQTIFKSLLNLLQYCFCFMLWFFGLLFFPDQGGTHTPCIGRQGLNPWTARAFHCKASPGCGPALALLGAVGIQPCSRSEVRDTYVHESRVCRACGGGLWRPPNPAAEMFCSHLVLLVCATCSGTLETVSESECCLCWGQSMKCYFPGKDRVTGCHWNQLSQGDLSKTEPIVKEVGEESEELSPCSALVRVSRHSAWWGSPSVPWWGSPITVPWWGSPPQCPGEGSPLQCPGEGPRPELVCVSPSLSMHSEPLGAAGHELWKLLSPTLQGTVNGCCVNDCLEN